MKPKLSSVSFDTIAPLNPFDKTASMISSKGEHFEVAVEGTRKHQDTPIPTTPITPDILKDPNFTDFRGCQFGRLKVVGKAKEGRTKIADRINKGQQRGWVVRCVCGIYEIRKNKTLRKFQTGENLENAACKWCNKTKSLQNGYGRGMRHKIEITPLFPTPSMKREEE